MESKESSEEKLLTDKEINFSMPAEKLIAKREQFIRKPKGITPEEATIRFKEQGRKDPIDGSYLNKTQKTKKIIPFQADHYNDGSGKPIFRAFITTRNNWIVGRIEKGIICLQHFWNCHVYLLKYGGNLPYRDFIQALHNNETSSIGLTEFLLTTGAGFCTAFTKLLHWLHEAQCDLLLAKDSLKASEQRIKELEEENRILRESMNESIS